MTTLEKTTLDQSYEQMFIETLDSIYYPGYVENIAETNLDKLMWEMAELQSQCSVKK